MPDSKKDIGTIERRRNSRSSMPLFLLGVGDIAAHQIGLCFMTLLVLHFITRSLWSSNLSECSKWKRTFSNSNIKDFLTFQDGSIIGAIKDDILMDDRIGWIYEVAWEIILSWRRNGQLYLEIGSSLMRYECY
jgi:hypothetical protein